VSWHWADRAGLGVGLLVGSWMALKQPALQRADVRAGDALRRAGTPALDRAVALTTDLGSVYATAGIAAALAAAGRGRPAADVLGVGATAWNVAQWNKTRVRRQRPYEAEGVRRLVRPPTGSSYPSGHAAVGLAVMSLLAGQARGPRSRALLYAIGVYVPVSRVYVGVHYPTDVVGGAGMGLALGALWRGPLAAVNGALIGAGAATLRRGLPVLLRRAVWVVLGVRLQPRDRVTVSGRRPAGPRRCAGGPVRDAGGRPGPSAAPATGPRRRSRG
jgi:undecaprenyl-diphosphatase